MIMVKIELWPMGDASRARPLGAVAIANVGGDTETGKYRAAVSHQIGSPYLPESKWAGYEAFAEEAFRPGFHAARPVMVWKRVYLEGFKRARGAVSLLTRVLGKARIP